MKILAVILLMVIPFLAFAQENAEKAIPWRQGKPLSWADYQGEPQPSSGAAASTATLISIGYNIGPKGFSYKISSTFSPAKSWVLHKTDHILQHEQGHFDIAEVFARKLHQRMQKYTFDESNFQRELRKIYQDIIDEKEAMQQRYDKETNHSINKEQQSAWSRAIAALLESTASYSNY